MLRVVDVLPKLDRTCENATTDDGARHDSSIKNVGRMRLAAVVTMVKEGGWRLKHEVTQPIGRRISSRSEPEVEVWVECL